MNCSVVVPSWRWVFKREASVWSGEMKPGRGGEGCCLETWVLNHRLSGW